MRNQFLLYTVRLLCKSYDTRSCGAFLNSVQCKLETMDFLYCTPSKDGTILRWAMVLCKNGSRDVYAEAGISTHCP